MPNTKLENWVQLVVKKQDFDDYRFEVTGNTSKEDGYLGDITFVTLTGKTKTGEKKLDLVIKASKESPKLREQTPIKQAFEKEIFIYEEVAKVFNNFQQEKTSEKILNCLPLCYATRIEPSNEVLILENLKPQGFLLWDRMKPMEFDYFKLVLEAYGTWHGFSLALRSHKKQQFEKLVANNVNMFSYFLKKTDMVALMWKLYDDSKKACIGENETELLENLQLSRSDADKVFTELFHEDPEHQVIVHGDCWNSNFMFKLEEKNGKPNSVRIIDWQCAGLASPVMDLSHFIYGCVDTGQYQEVTELLTIYHQSLTKCLTRLGCDPNKVFPFDKLIEHWKNFSHYGLLLHAFVIKFSTCEVSDTPDLAEAADEGKPFLDNFNIDVSNKEEFYRRIRNNLIHYVHNLF